MSIRETLEYLKAKRAYRMKAAGYNPYFVKSAAQPPAGGPPPGGDPSMGGGMPPGGDPSMGGGMPPGGDPSMGGGAPPMDPSMMGGGGMPPGMDPSMMGGGGMPPMDPSMMMGMMGGGMPPMGGAPQSPQETEQKVTNKIKTEQWMQHIDSYNYNLLKLMINLYEHLGIPVPAESLIQQPLGSSSPSAGDISGMMGAAADATAPQTPVDAMANGDAAPPQGGGAPPMDPSMMDPSMMGGDPSMGGGMPPEGMPPEGMPPEGAPPEGMPPKQSSWNMYNPYTGRMNTSWRAPYQRQVGVKPTVKQANKQNQVFRYPAQYSDMMTKMNKLRGFN